ncbi:MAG: RCC1 domain-containing protein [Polyangiales bacterium]
MKRLILFALLLGCARRNEKKPVETEQPAGPRDAVEIAAFGASTCLRTGEGNVRCWGELVHQPTPKPMDVTEAAQIVVGAKEGCAIVASGKVVCFGPARREVPIIDAAELSAYGESTCARQRTGGISCFESGGAPTPVAEVNDAIRVVVGGAHRCAVRRDGSLTCFRGTVPSLKGATELAAGGSTACAIVGGEHRVACYDAAGKPIELVGLDGVVQLSVGDSQSCATHQHGTVFCWGADAKPREIPDLRNVVQVAVGAAHVCALKRSGAIVCWGKNDQGQLGDGSKQDSPAPVSVKL